MGQEGQLLDKKSLRSVTGRTADWNELAKDCVAFANATGGRLLIGIEDGDDLPPEGQQVPADIPDAVRRRIAELTVNVVVLPNIVTATNGGQYIELSIPRSMGVASTTEGRYFFADRSRNPSLAFAPGSGATGSGRQALPGRGKERDPLSRFLIWLSGAPI